MPVRERVLTAYGKWRRWLPMVFFFAGFAWDAVTLGRTIKSLDLFLLCGYLAAAAVILLLIGRGVTFRGSQYLNAVLQFLFGGIFSALFIFYFLSSSDLPGYVVVLALGAMLVGNEFLESRYSELTLSWVFFTLCAIMFFNFALAHLFRSVNVFYFYLGTLVAVLAVLLLRRFSAKAAASPWPSMAVAALMLVLHAANAIPPVPLVKKEMLVAHELRRTNGAYEGRIESPGWRFWRSCAKEFHRSGNERVYAFTSIFAPSGITTTIRHRWDYYDERRGEWITTTVVPIAISGGRKTGFRALSFKRNLPPGDWRVIAESESGAAIGVIEFTVVPGRAETLRTVRL